MEMLNRAITLATQYHDGQTRRGGEPYILHPLRVMMSMSKLPPKHREYAMSVAVLHDVLEKTECTDYDLDQYGITTEIIQDVEILTHKKKEPYSRYISNIGFYGDRHVILIKLADIKDNLDDPFCTSHQKAKYAEAIPVLENALKHRQFSLPYADLYHR